DRGAGERFEPADDNGVRCCIRADRIQRLLGRDPEPLPLARSEPPVTVVLAELVSVLVDDRALLRLKPATLEERPVVVAGKETRLLTLAAARRFEAGALGLGARLSLGLCTERERDPVKLRGIDPGEHVRLVLPWIEAAREQEPAAMLDDPCVVPGCKLVRSRTVSEREQPREAEAAVALDAWVGCLPTFVTSDERVDHGTPKLFAKVEGHVRDAERVARRTGSENRIGRATGALRVGPVGIEPEPQRDADRVRQELEQRNGAVNAAAHCNRDPPG